MRRRYFFTLLFLAFGFLPHTARADFACNADPQMMVSHDFSDEVYGEHWFTQTLGMYKIVLKPKPFGWDIKVYSTDGDIEIPVTAPPIRPVETNPVRISGV